MAWTPWSTFSGIRQSAGAGLMPDWVPTYYRAAPTTRSERVGTSHYSMVESYPSHQNGWYPHLDGAARVCALTHARNGESWLHSGWNPGECNPLDTTAPHTTLGGSSAAGMQVGHTSSVSAEPSPFLGWLLSVYVHHAVAAMGWEPLWQRLGQPEPTDYRKAQNVPGEVLAQVPGMITALGEGQLPEVEVLRVDGEAWFALDEQPYSTAPFDVAAHPRTRTDTLAAPYQSLTSFALSTPAVGGTTSSKLEFPDMAVGETHTYDISSSRVLGGFDPGYTENSYQHVRWATDFVWSVRVRFEVDEITNVCRWRQRDDGLGLTGAPRARSGTSRQRGDRHRGYR